MRLDKTVQGGCGNGDGHDAEPRPPDVQCSVGPRVTLRMMVAQSQISRRAGHIPPQILNLLMMQNGNHCREGQPPPLSRDTRATVKK